MSVFLSADLGIYEMEILDFHSLEHIFLVMLCAFFACLALCKKISYFYPLSLSEI